MLLFLSELHHLSELELDNAECAPPFSNIFIDALPSSASVCVQSGSSSTCLLPTLVSIRYLGPITLRSDTFIDLLYPKDNVSGTGDAPQLKSVMVRGYESVDESGHLTQAESLRTKELKVDMQGSGRGTFIELYMNSLPILGSTDGDGEVYRRI